MRFTVCAAAVAVALVVGAAGQRSRDELKCTCFEWPRVLNPENDAAEAANTYNEWVRNHPEEPQHFVDAYPTNRTSTNYINSGEICRLDGPALSNEICKRAALDVWTPEDYDECASVCAECHCAGYNFDEGNACFPATATVELEGGAVVPMEQLAVGASVRVSPTEFSEVLFFTHRDTSAKSQFVVLAAAGLGQPLRLSPGHYVYANGQLVTARTVAVGDVLQTKAGDLPVSKVTIESDLTGLYNPQTAHGDIVVDGVVASTFTDTVNPKLAGMLVWSLSALQRAGISPASTIEASSATLASLARNLGLSGSQQYPAAATR